ncbi:sodium-coupled monocarboxylate transporter 1-like [Schistocerca americana]|uniref:sodium-coupled monocarboxylate transporter 1-like n=1 Tax=Schistocerca americana TaxID=7009 RepID=UPI001F4FD3FE|nr:sodium-coupled monocarboxylate transporter 1-like [Schistocerca americana]
MSVSRGEAPLLGVVDYTVFALMLSVSAAIGVYYGFFARSSGADDYLVGGRSMSTIPVSMSLIASFISGIMLLGIATESYLYGMQYAYVCLGVILSSAINAFAFLPVFYDLGITSTYEYLDMRFGRSARLLGSFFFVTFTLVWIPIVIYVPAVAFNQVTGINIHIVSCAVCVVCIFYTCVGGIKAVVWTDVVQTVFMFGGVLLVIFKGTADVGGFGVVWSRNLQSGRIEPPVLDPDPKVRTALPSLVLGGAIHWLAVSGIHQMMIQRYMSLPSLSKANRALCIFTVGSMCLVLICSYCGLLMYARYFDCDPLTTKMARAKDQLLPLMVADSLGGFPGLPGLFVASVFSAALSSLSTALNSMSAVVLEDFWKVFFPSRRLSERQTDLLMKGVVVAVGVLCTALVFVVEKMGSAVLQMAISLGSMSHGPSLALFTTGMFFSWVNAKSAIVGSMTGMGMMGWLVIGAQLHQARGNIGFATKPLSTDGCLYEFDHSQNGTVAVPSDFCTSEVWAVYCVSYLWYTALGLVTSVTVSLVASIFLRQDASRPDARLISPLVRRWLPPASRPQIYKVVEMETMPAVEQRKVYDPPDNALSQ